MGELNIGLLTTSKPAQVLQKPVRKDIIETSKDRVDGTTVWLHFVFVKIT